MAVICIAGISPGIGKTSIAEMLLGELGGWHAARVRVADEIGEAHAAILEGAGHVLLDAEELADDPEVVRFLAAGAAGASVLLAEPRGLTAGVLALRRSVPAEANLLVEGNAYLWDADADVAVMVIGPGRSGKGLARVRPSVRELFDKIGVWVWNTRTNPTDEGFFEFPQAMARLGFARAITNRADYHHVNPASEADAGNAPFLAAVRQRLEGDWVQRGAQEFLRRVGFDTDTDREQGTGNGE
ncbi:MAG: hypothetical protein AMK72_08895 [Planctomycetes bacterium SM23_25]|nr:MAG: hypothetical protein AMK72_08895 [Planctomycetes bacterium SM23_25]